VQSGLLLRVDEDGGDAADELEEVGFICWFVVWMVMWLSFGFVCWLLDENG